MGLKTQCLGVVIKAKVLEVKIKMCIKAKVNTVKAIKAKMVGLIIGV